MNDRSMAQDSDITEQEVADFRKVMDEIRTEVGRVVVGQDSVVEHLLFTLLVGGHCLVTGMPGTAKTLLVRTLANALGLNFSRIQFTPDLMPGDITGTDIIEEDAIDGHRQWKFVPGPIFTNVLLADEINRTPPKTQAALLEAMQENAATVRGQRHAIENPFFVLATQNPLELEGTYPLPEAQLDRFLFNVLLDYLEDQEEFEVVRRYTSHNTVAAVKPCTNASQIIRFQQLVRQVPIAESVSQYAVSLVRMTRPQEADSPEIVKRYVKFGASVRATLFLVLSAKARALMSGRYHVTEDDIRALAKPVLRHRVMCNYFADSDGLTVESVLDELISTVTR